MFNREVLERISRAGHTNAEPFWFYIPALLVALLPSVVFLPCVALVLPGRFSHSEVARSRAAFLWGWALLPVVLFSFSSGKETRYLLPTLPAWTLLLAWGWIRARASSRFQGWRRGLARTLDVATWILPLAWLAAGLWFFPDNTAVVVASAVCALVARAVFAWSLRSGKPAIALCMLVLAVATAKFAWAGTLLERQRAKIPVEEAGRAIAARLAPGEPWILIGRYRSWLDFAVNRPCLVVPDWAELAAVRAGQRGAQARFAFTLEQAIPATQVSLERVERWVVDGDAYCLVRLYGVR